MVSIAGQAPSAPRPVPGMTHVMYGAIAIVAATACSADAVGEWSWLGGSMECSADTDLRCRGIYEGISPSPGARCCAHVWAEPGTDLAYIFGGYGYDKLGHLGYLNDLWRINTSSSPSWQFIGGSPEANPRGTADWPAGRHYAAYALDIDGDAFWLFSGQGTGDEFLPDLWRLDLRTFEWMHKGNFSRPSPRKWSTFWADSGGMWVLGGETPAQVNDMWELSYATEHWVEVYDRTSDPQGQYQGNRTFPGERHNAFTSITKGMLWMFGGSGWGAHERGTTSDFWQFNVSTRTWKFIGGNAGGVEKEGKCGPRGISGHEYLPTARHAGHNFDSPSADGRMFVFGGEHMSEKDVFNDLWSVDLEVSNNWTLEAGNCNQPNITHSKHGSAGIAAPANTPKSLFAGNGWWDMHGNAWIFGGSRLGYVNDLWRFTRSTAIYV